MKLNDEQNLAFVNDPRRVAAQKELDDAKHMIEISLRPDASANYYLSVLPQRLKRLEEASENLAVVEATVEAELLEQHRYHE